jgi:hypothetical protein
VTVGLAESRSCQVSLPSSGLPSTYHWFLQRRVAAHADGMRSGSLFHRREWWMRTAVKWIDGELRGGGSRHQKRRRRWWTDRRPARSPRSHEVVCPVADRSEPRRKSCSTFRYCRDVIQIPRVGELPAVVSHRVAAMV